MSEAEESGRCPNCDEPISGEKYCPNCGQKTNNHRLTVQHFISETLSNFFAFDGRFFLTFKVLFTKPGRVARNFINGQRMRYMNPVRIYFLSSLLLLTVLQFRGSDKSLIKQTEKPSEEVNIPADTSATDTISNMKVDTSESGEGSNAEHFYKRIKNMQRHYEDKPQLSTDDALRDMGIEPDFYHRFLYVQAAKISNFDMDEFNKYLFSKLFWVLFLFLPIIAIILKLLYIRRKFYYPEHLIFTFYNQSVFFLLLSIILPWSHTEGPALLAGFLFAIYLYIAMRRFYQQGRLKTFIKFILLNSLIVPAFGIFFALATLVVFILF